MNRIMRLVVAFGITTMIFVAGFFFVTSVTVSGECVGMSDVDIIKQQTTFRVVPPEWVKPGRGDGLFWTWMMAESVTRLVLVLIAWLLALIFINPDKWKQGKSEKAGAARK